MAKKSSSVNQRIKLQKKKLLEHLSESGNVSYACKRTGISRETYYCWRSKDDSFTQKADEAIIDGKEFVNDLAHTKLMQSIQDGHFPAIKFQLSNCHQDYHPKKVTPPFRPEDHEINSITTVLMKARMNRYIEFIENGGDPNDWEM